MCQNMEIHTPKMKYAENYAPLSVNFPKCRKSYPKMEYSKNNAPLGVKFPKHRNPYTKNEISKNYAPMSVIFPKRRHCCSKTRYPIDPLSILGPQTQFPCAPTIHNGQIPQFPIYPLSKWPPNPISLCADYPQCPNTPISQPCLHA